MDQQTQKLLRDAIGAACQIIEYTGDVEFAEFASERMRQQATFYAFAVLGEALNKLTKLDPSVRQQISDVQVAIDMRIRIIHGYATVDVGIVWATARMDIPNVAEVLSVLLDSY